ncbi:unnamed protein product [Closterium sp. NIES-53]
MITCLPESLCTVRDLLLALDPTDLTVDLLEKHLLAVETSIDAVGASRGTPRTPFFEGCSPSPLVPSVASAAAVDFLYAEEVALVSTPSGRRRSGRGKGGQVGGVAAVEAVVGAVEAVEVAVVAVGVVVGVEALVTAVVVAVVAVVGVAAAAVVAAGVVVAGVVVAVWVELFRREALAVASGSSSSFRARPLRPSSFVSGFLTVGRLGVVFTARMSGVDIFALDYDAILAAMYALSVSAEGDCYLCVPLYPCIEVAALGASKSALPGTAPAEALHTFMLESGASRCFFPDNTTLIPLPAPFPVKQADPSGGPVLARSSTVLPCPAVPSSSLLGLHLPLFSTNLVSTAALQDAMVTTTTPGGQHVSNCTCTRTSRHLATFTCRPRSSLYTLATEPPQVAASAQVSASGPVAPPCLCRLLTLRTLLWHHRLGHPSLPRLHGMHSRLLVSSLPKSLPPLPPSPAPPCLPCVEGRQRTASHSSSFPPMTTPLQTRHMDVWGPARVSGQGCERYFLLVVDDYMRYTTVFPLHTKGEVPDVLIPCIRAVCLQLRERFRQDLPVLRLHSDRGGEFSSNLLQDFFGGEGILQSFTLPASPQQNGIAECRIGLVMEVARTSMIHAASPHFLWPFAVWYAAHQLNLWPRVSLLETSPTLDGEGWQCDGVLVLPTHLAPCPPLSRRHGPSPSGVSQVDPLPGSVPVEVVVDSGAARGDASGGAAPGGDAGAGDAVGVGAGGTRAGAIGVTGVASPGGARTGKTGAAGAGSAAGVGVGRTGAGAAGVTRATARGIGAGATGVTGAAGPGGAYTGGTGAAGAGRATVVGAGRMELELLEIPEPLVPEVLVLEVQELLEMVVLHELELEAQELDLLGVLELLELVVLQELELETPELEALALGVQCPPPNQSQPPLQPASPLPAPSPYTEQTRGLTEHRDPLSRPASRVRTGRRVPRQRPPPVLDTHHMALHPSSVRQQVPLTVLLRPLWLTDWTLICHLDYATALVAEVESACPPSVGGECALGTDVFEDKKGTLSVLRLLGTNVDAVPPSGANIVDGMWIFRTFSPTLKMTTLRVLLHVAAQRDYELHSLDFCTAFLQGSLHEIWLRRPPGFTGSFPAGTQCSLRWPVYGLRQVPREWHDTRKTTLAALRFAPSSADPSLFLRTDTSLPPFYVLVYVLQRFGVRYSSPQSTPLPTGHSLSAPPSNKSVELSGPYPELVGCLITSGIGLLIRGRGPVVLIGHADTSRVDDLATQRTTQGYTFSLGSGSNSLWSTFSSSVLSSSCEAGIYAGAMAAQELCWLAYLLPDLGERPRSSPILYVDKKAMIALCQEHRLEHRTKNIALRYFLARKLQQRGQLRLPYVATRANTIDLFTKALQSGDHQLFCTVHGLRAKRLRGYARSGRVHVIRYMRQPTSSGYGPLGSTDWSKGGAESEWPIDRGVGCGEENRKLRR